MPARYHLEPDAFVGVATSIEREYEDAQLSAFQRNCFAWLRGLAYAIPLIVAALLTLEALPAGFQTISVLLQIVGTLVVLATALVLLLSAPLLTKAVRQVKLARSLHLLEIADKFWTRAARPRPSRGLRTVVYLGPSILLLLLFLSALAFGPVDQDLAVTWSQTALVLAVCCGLPFAVHGLERLFERLRDRLDHFDEVRNLRLELGRLGAGAADGSLELPADLAMRLADMEKIHILQRRAAAIAAADRDAETGYSIAREPEVRRECKRLTPPDRQRVEETILRLGLAPELGEPSPAAEGRERVLRVEGTDLEIRYTVAERGRQIEIRALTRAPEVGPERSGE
jgi:hypothetical protein